MGADGRRLPGVRVRVKVRNVFHQPFTDKETYWPVTPTTQAGDHTYIKASTRYISVPVKGGGGPVCVIDQTKPGRITKPNLLVDHSGPVTDCSWNPFNQSFLATGSADATVKLWQIPDQGP